MPMQGTTVPYDAVILGSGIGGLVSGTYLAKSGIKVLILESQNRIGGRCGSNIHKGYAIDRLVVISHKILLEVMEELGIPFQWHTLPPNPAYIQPFDKIVPYPVLSNVGETAQLLGQPRDLVSRYKDLMDRLSSMNRADASKLKNTRLIDWVPPERWKEIGSILAVDFQFRPWAITPEQAGELSVGELIKLLTAGGPTESPIPQTKLYPVDPVIGGLQAVPEAFSKVIRQHGGEIRTSCLAVEIEIEKNKVTGVSFLNEDGMIEQVVAPVVISDIPIWDTFGKVLDGKSFPEKFVANAGLLAEWNIESLEIGIALSDLPKRRSDGKKEDVCRWCRVLLGEPGHLRYAGGHIFTSLGSPASAPKGKHLIIVCRCVPKGTIRNTPLLKSMAMENIEVLRRIYSNFDDVCEWWAILPYNRSVPIHCLSTIDRPGIQGLGVEGLYLVGDTVETGGGRPYGFDLAAYSGMQASKMILGGK